MVMRDEDPMVRWPVLWFLLLSIKSQGHGDGSRVPWSIGLKTEPQFQT